MAYVNDQQQLIHELKKNIAACRKQYAYWRQWCRDAHELEVWVHMEAAIVAKADYYAAELIRAKHNIARYSLGADVQEPFRLAEAWVADIDEALREVPSRLQDMENDNKLVKKAGDNKTKRELAVSTFELANSLYEMTVAQLDDRAQALRRKTYGGTV